MTPRSRQIVKVVIRFLVTTGLLIWVFTQIDLTQFGRAVQEAKWPFLIAVWGLTVILFWIRSFKMRLVLRRQGCDVRTGTIFGATTMTAMYSLILPGILSTGVKWYILKRNTGKGSNVLSSMLYNQLATMIVMTVFGLAALMISNPTALLIPNSRNQNLLPAVCGVLLAAVLLGTLLLLNGRTGGGVIKVLKLLLLPLPEKARQKGGEILDQIAVFQAVEWRFHLTFVLITVADTLVGGVASYVLAARTAHIVAPVSVFVWLCAGVYILGRIPISVANLGVREATLVGILAIYGVEKSAAMLMSMVLFSALVFMAGIGTAYQVAWTLAPQQPAQRPDNPSS
jgi:glycosyltransferase 2 family protein